MEKQTVDFAGYWRPRRTQDDPPTAQDLADAQELLARAEELAARAKDRWRRPRPSDARRAEIRLGRGNAAGVRAE